MKKVLTFVFTFAIFVAITRTNEYASIGNENWNLTFEEDRKRIGTGMFEYKGYIYEYDYEYELPRTLGNTDIPYYLGNAEIEAENMACRMEKIRKIKLQHDKEVKKIKEKRGEKR